MVEQYVLKDAIMGGPGLRGYAYRADVLCVACSHNTIKTLWSQRMFSSAPYWELSEFQDSNVLPQPMFFPESGTKEHCGVCDRYLYGPNIVED